MRILLKYPTRARPEKFKNTLKLYKTMLSGKHTCTFLISCDANDSTMNNDVIRKYITDLIPDAIIKYGTSKTKIEAINADMEGIEFDVLILVSDDMIPVVKGYDDVVATNMTKFFPDFYGALYFPDGRQGKLNTLSIMGRRLYDYFGYIYHPAYKSLWCDNEYHDVIHRLNKVIFIKQVIIKHEWTNYTGKDQLHIKNESYYKEDQATYNRRKSLGFPK